MMRKFLNNAAVKLTAATLCLAMLSTAVDARLLTVSFEQPRILPGVDANGNLDYFNGGDASYKVIVNTRQQRTYVNGRGKVDNLSDATYAWKTSSWEVFSLFPKRKSRPHRLSHPFTPCHPAGQHS